MTYYWIRKPNGQWIVIHACGRYVSYRNSQCTEPVSVERQITANTLKFAREYGWSILKIRHNGKISTRN